MRRPGTWLLVVLAATPVALWATTTDTSIGDRFSGRAITLQSLAVVAALVAYSLFATNVVLAARLPGAPALFGGLDHLYDAHRRVGASVAIGLVLHALLMTASRWDLGGWAAAGDLWLPRSGSAQFAGVVVLAVLVAGVLAAFYAPLRHGAFIAVQRLMGGLFLVAGWHVFRQRGSKAESWWLTAVLAAYAVASGTAWLYRSVLYRFAVPRRHYTVVAVNELDDRVVEVVLEPERDDERLPFVAGQFAFLALGYPAVDVGPHPFSITSGENERQLRFVVKALGDHTSAVHDRLHKGVRARVEGAYGGLCHQKMPRFRQVWIAGGIGITPFLSMARSLDGGKYQSGEYDVELFWGVQHRGEAYFESELASLDPRLRLHVVAEDEVGFISAALVRERVPDVASREVLVCGPPVMLANLRRQLVDAGVPAVQIHAEEFAFH